MPTVATLTYGNALGLLSELKQPFSMRKVDLNAGFAILPLKVSVSTAHPLKKGETMFHDYTLYRDETNEDYQARLSQADTNKALAKKILIHYNEENIGVEKVLVGRG
jgi:hypothetical protein